MTRRNGCTQDVLILPETAGVEVTRLEADDLYAADHERPAAWELDFNQQAKNERTGVFLQVISVLSKKPVKIYRGKPERSSQSTTTIASNAQDRALTFQGRRKSKNSLVLWLGIFLLSLVMIIGIIVLVNMGDKPAITPAVGIPVIGAVLSRRLVKTADILGPDDYKNAPRDGTGTVLCIIVEEKTSTWDYHNIRRNLIPEGATEREYKGQDFFLLGLTPEGQLWSIEPPRDVKDGEDPLSLYLFLDYEEEVDELIGMDRSILEKIKIGILVGLSVGVLIIFFLVIMTALGGTTVG